MKIKIRKKMIHKRKHLLIFIIAGIFGNVSTVSGILINENPMSLTLLSVGLMLYRVSIYSFCKSFPEI